MKKILCLLFLAIALTAVCQRRITPVTTGATMTQSRNEVKNDSIDRSSLVEMHDADGRVVLVDTVTGKEFVDSVAIKKKKEVSYPLFHSASVSVDIWNPLMRLFGQKYGLVGFAAQVNLKNRFIPTFEFGLGNANYNPDDNNYTFHSGISPYFKIGLDYNFLYKSNPDYLAFAGLRYGFSPFKYQIQDVTTGSDYWGEKGPVDFPEQSYTAGWIEISFGIRAKIWDNISLGWTFKYHNKIHGSDKEMGKPWYIPGYGTTGSKIGASFSIYYTLPLGNYKKHSAPKQGNTPGDINAGTEIVPADNVAQPATVSPSDNGNQNEQ